MTPDRERPATGASRWPWPIPSSVCGAW